MSTFSALLKQHALAKKRAACRTIIVPPTAFASGWRDRPTEGAAIGLRLISEDDAQKARGEAARLAYAFHADDAQADERTDAFNDALMRWVVARGTCRPDDEQEPWFEMAEDTVRIALTSEGTRLLYEAIERLHIEESPTYPEATDEELTELASLLSTKDTWQALPLPNARRARRLLAHVLEQLRR